MCLETITNRKPKTTGFGWKVYNESTITEGGLCSIYAGLRNLPSNQWLLNGDYPANNYNGLSTIKEYTPAWHIFMKEEDAKEQTENFGSIAKKVQYKKAFIRGLDFVTRPVIVAKEIKILEEAV